MDEIFPARRLFFMLKNVQCLSVKINSSISFLFVIIFPRKTNTLDYKYFHLPRNGHLKLELCTIENKKYTANRLINPL